MEGGPDSVCVLGIDLGTTSVKAALVVGTERGQVVAESCSRETQAYTSSVEAGLPVVGTCAGKGQGLEALLVVPGWLLCGGWVVLLAYRDSGGFPGFFLLLLFLCLQ